ncbi:MAG: bifunctional chorismate mutase/prephenate dehydrogenase [Neisseriaceae bacterium]
MNNAISKKITIIGGNGGMGQLFSKLWKEFDVWILDKDDWSNADLLLNNADLVVISVPINLTEEVIQLAAKFITKKCILADFTSIKTKPINEMLRHHSGSVVGLHPMFGHKIDDPHNQIIINCGGRDLGNCSWIFESLQSIGFKLIAMPPAKHDQIMSFIQGIEHFSTFALGNFLKQHNIRPNEILEISSPIYQTKLALMGRIFDQDPKLYADIIMSDDSRIELITQYINYLETLKNMLVNKDKESFINSFIKVSDWMGEFTSNSQESTDKLFSNLSNFVNSK